MTKTAIVLGTIASLFLGGTAIAQDSYTFAVVPKATSHLFWLSVQAGAMAAGEEYGVQIEWNGAAAETEYPRQIQIVDSFISRKVDGIALAPTERKALVGAVDRAAQAGIPLTVFDSGLDSENYMSFLATNNYEGGQMVGRALARLLNGNGKVGMVMHAPGSGSTMDRERRARMTEACARPGPLQDRIKHGWIPLFTPPPFPDYTPKEVLAGLAQTVEERFGKTAALVRKLQARGGKIVFVRFPHSGELKKLEDAATPRSAAWTRLMNETKAPNIYYSDHPDLMFECPEWSHLSGPDSVEFSQRLVPYLKAALAQ